MAHSRIKVLCTSSVASLVLGCGPIIGTGPDDPPVVVDDGLPPASTFSCADLDGTQLACVDFNDGTQGPMVGEGGEWQVIGGRLVGFGPDTTPGSCTDSLMTHCMDNDVTVQDLKVHAQFSSIQRVDKVIALRSTDAGNRLQLNFRALDETGAFGDLIIQELRDCVFTELTAEGAIALPNDTMGVAVDVDVELIGTHLTVDVGGTRVFDDDVPIVVQSGHVGFGVIERSETMFDDFVVWSR